MTATFDVLTQGWIPVTDPEGNLRKVGLAESLKNAHKFVGISDPSPMVEYGLHRFLSVFLMDALRPADQEALEDLLEEGAFDGETIDGYIARCRSEGVSFDLFDSERPFLQTPYVPELDEKKEKPAATLDYTLPSGNNHTHFDHRRTIAFSFDEAAKLLVPAQIFCTAGLQGPSNVSGAPPYYTVVKGRTLFETLIFSMIPLDQINISFDDPPVFWRNQMPVNPREEVAETSWLYGMLFPARRITLVPDETVVTGIYLSAGLDFKTMESWEDPSVTYRYGKNGRAPWRPNQEKAVWRNLNDLVNVNGKRAPAVLRQYFALEKDSEEAYITLYGVQTNQASFLNAVQYDLQIPAQLTRDDDLLQCVTLEIRAAENMGKALRGTFQNAPEIVPSMVTQAVNSFYDRCGQKIWSLCRNAGTEELRTQYSNWCDFVKKTAQDVRADVLLQSHLTGRALANAAAHDRDIPDMDRKNKKEME